MLPHLSLRVPNESEVRSAKEVWVWGKTWDTHQQRRNNVRRWEARSGAVPTVPMVSIVPVVPRRTSQRSPQKNFAFFVVKRKSQLLA